jgi:hypothetical protein
MNQLLLALTFAFIALSAGISAAPAVTPQTQEVNLYVVRALYSMIDFDGGHYFYVRMEDSNRTLSTWELQRNSDFYAIQNDDWQVGDDIVRNGNKLTNMRTGSQYAFFSAGNWWYKKE